ncbi:MAG TPA: Uma2 family endonuclease [Thermoanaerobaculia bacterium]|jgi:hypothetical protein|nr:Uma2 family endonuclease [Thermoanaerobaculia bacterium]
MRTVLRSTVVAFFLLGFGVAFDAQAILQCSDCGCSFACSTTCVLPLGGFSTCNAQGLCAGKPGCGGGCLTFGDVESAFLGLPALPLGPAQGRAAARLTTRLASHVETFGLGTVYSAQTGFLVPKTGGKLKAPDLAFVSAERGGIPALVAQILPSSTFAKIAAKDAESWLAAGSRAALVVDSERRTVTLFASGAKPRVLGGGDFLELPSILPGLSFRVGDLFE